jgi:short subunit dehydrogenase-like uncharacterized protein
MRADWMIYGANGYTGELIARHAVAGGQRPVLAGRNADALASLARELGLPWRAFPLDRPDELDAGLEGMGAVVHAAGPFSRTSRPMTDACLRRRVNYLDITGEIGVLEALAERDREARSAGVSLLPAVGFDVVPTDGLAAHLKRRLPGATALSLAFKTTGRMSRGTMRTALERLGEGGWVRRGSVLTPVPSGWKVREVDFGRGPERAVTIPWGDVATAWRTTGIPDIEVYLAAPARLIRTLRIARWLGPILRTGFLRRLALRRVASAPPGPSNAERERGRCWIWGEVVDDEGRRAVSRMITPEGYTLTARAAVAAAGRVLAGMVPAGFQTPSLAFGADFPLELEGVSREDL